MLPAAMSLSTLVSTTGPAPSAWICVLPVVVLRRIMRSLVSPGPTYCRMPAVVLALPKVNALAARLAFVLEPTLVPVTVSVFAVMSALRPVGCVSV